MFSPDDDLENADWTKEAWDFDSDMTVEDVRAMIRSMGLTVEQFKQLPVYKRNRMKIVVLREL